MAFTFTTLTKGGSDTDGRDYTTASCPFSAHPGKMFIAAVVGFEAGTGHAIEQGTCAGGGLTWSPKGGNGNGNIWLRFFRASGTGSDEAVTFTGIADPGESIGGAAWIVLAVDGVDTTTNDGMVQSHNFEEGNRTGADTLELVPLNAFASADNANLAFFVSLDTAGGTLNFTQGSGFTAIDEIDQTINADTVTMFAEYKLNDTTADASVSTANDALTGHALEIAAATAGTAIKTINGVPKASVKTVNGVPIASVKTWQGLP